MFSTFVIGAGRMGSALARALLKRDIPVRVWNRTPERCEPLARSGAVISSSIEDGALASDVVIVNVIDYAAADALLGASPVTAALAGKLLVQLTSGSPQQARDVARWAAEHGIRYLDGAIMATPNMMGTPAATILYSGSSDAFHTHQGVLLALGSASHVGEDAGHAAALDIALLSQLWGTLFGTLYASAVSEAEGIDLPAFDRYLQPFKPVIDGAAADLIARIHERRYRGDAQTLATIAAHHSAFQHLLHTVAARGFDGAVPAAFDGLFRSAIAAGHLDDDFAALAPFVRRTLP